MVYSNIFVSHFLRTCFSNMIVFFLLSIFEYIIFAIAEDRVLWNYIEHNIFMFTDEETFYYKWLICTNKSFYLLTVFSCRMPHKIIFKRITTGLKSVLFLLNWLLHLGLIDQSIILFTHILGEMDWFPKILELSETQTVLSKPRNWLADAISLDDNHLTK